jgi:hypothetical protein
MQSVGASAPLHPLSNPATDAPAASLTEPGSPTE